MKSIVTFICLAISSLTFAQDGYHSFESVQCENNESCLVNPKYNHVIKLIPVENEDGQIDGARLSSDSYLADTVYPGSNVCFRGNAVEVCSMMDMMSNGEGGHATISNFKCSSSNKLIDLKYDVEYDGYGTDVLKFEIKKCE